MAKSKSFRNDENPAMSYLTLENTSNKQDVGDLQGRKSLEQPVPATRSEGKEKGKEKKDKKVPREKKTKPISLITIPSLYEDIQILAQIKQKSVNQTLVDAIQETVEQNRDKIEMYKKLTKELFG